MKILDGRVWLSPSDVTAYLACEHLTARSQRALVADWNAEDCAHALASAHKELTSKDIADLRDTRVVSVAVSGDAAAVRLEPEDDAGAPTLVKTDGEWLLELPAP